MNKIEGVLFDLDGTLLDTAKDLGETLNFILQQHDIAPLSFHQYRITAANGVKALLELGFKEQLVELDINNLIQQFFAHYQQNIAHHTKFYDGIEAMLDSLNNSNIPWGIVTNKPGFLTTPLLAQFDIFAHSKTNISGDTLSRRKPHPEPMLLAASELNIPCQQILYLGDAERDMQAGNAVNMTTVVANWGYIDEPEPLAAWQADHIINKPEQLMQFIK
ncbi:HAD family hydrolase [Thalassotalea aquiviva]|uniref:HAD family hydrolase n=1 Tax=Thalassotalea aquiviva TaxID=3242415 RepID=UPI00352A5804